LQGSRGEFGTWKLTTASQFCAICAVAELGHQTSTSDAHRRGGRWGVHCSVPRGSGFRCRTWGWRMGSEG
jgi:hypothetical protein